MNWRQPVLWGLLRLSGSGVPGKYRDILSLTECDTEAAVENAERRLNNQLKKLGQLIHHVCEHVPYYREAFAHADLFNPEGMLDGQAFQRLPLLGKTELRREFVALQSTDNEKRQCFDNSSGGSTGEPTRFVQDNDYRDGDIAATLHLFKTAGKEMGEAELKLWGSERDIEAGSIGWRARTENWLYNRTLFNSFRFSEVDMFKLASVWQRKRPVAVWTYVDSIVEFACFLEKNGIEVSSPKAIVTTAATLDPLAREFLGKIFKCPILNQYGSREVGVLACEEPGQEGLTLFEWKHYVEVLNEKGEPCAPGEEGEIVVTCLENYAMPLIRYRIGDRGILSDDRPLMRLAKVTGRITDHFICRDGTLIHGEYFTHLFYFKDWVKQFQVVQDDYEQVTCRVVPQKRAVSSDMTEIEARIQNVLGGKCVVRFEMVDNIEPSGSGKFLYTRCEVERH